MIDRLKSNLASSVLSFLWQPAEKSHTSDFKRTSTHPTVTRSPPIYTLDYDKQLSEDRAIDSSLAPSCSGSICPHHISVPHLQLRSPTPSQSSTKKHIPSCPPGAVTLSLRLFFHVNITTLNHFLRGILSTCQNYDLPAKPLSISDSNTLNEPLTLATIIWSFQQLLFSSRRWIQFI